MKTTRALLAAFALVLLVAATIFALLNLRLPVAEFIGYGTSGLFVAGLLAMLAADQRPARLAPPATRTGPAKTTTRPTVRRLALRRAFTHA